MNMIKELMKKYRELILYVVFGGMTTLVSLASYWLLTDVCQLHYMVSNVLSWVISVTFAYITNRIWVFESRAVTAAAVLREIVSFFACRVSSGLMETAMMFLGVDMLHMNDKAVKLIANVFVIIANYVLSKVIVFRKKSN